MHDKDLGSVTAVELAELVRTKKVSPVEITRATLARIDRLQPEFNCFITVCHEEAMSAACAAEEAVMTGAPLGLLHGVPFSVKDMINTKGIRTTFGSLTMTDNVPDRDDLSVRRMKESGAILIGKTTTPEFAHCAKTESPVFGRTRNAWSAEHTSGGSSGGGAVAIATGMCTLAVTTDAGGSTRIPAACNGVVGHKQSYGVIPDDAVMDGFNTVIAVTPMARNATDTAVMMDVLSGPHPSDPFSLYRPKQASFPNVIGASDLKGVRIARLPVLPGYRVDPEVAAAFDRSLLILEQLGAVVVDASPRRFYPDPTIWERQPRAWATIHGSLRRLRYANSIENQREKLTKSFLHLVETSEGVTRTMYQEALFLRARLLKDVQGWFDEVDIVATPTLTRTAISIDHDILEPIEVDGQLAGTVHTGWFPHTHVFNMTGHPALSIPCGRGRNNLPIGLQLIGSWGSDELLLKSARAFECSYSQDAIPAF
jgi:aspartyl-tRNA(Asn)/glutamyl-tRNA(Gln) amidotransferase subunit A